MTVAFDRTVRIVVGGNDVSDLQVDFTIDAQLSAEPDKCELAIFNLSPNTRGAIEQLPRDSQVLVEAGYAGATSQIFLGSFRRAVTERQGIERVTLVEAAAGGQFRARSRRLDRAYGKGTRLSTVINDAISATGVGRGNVDTLLQTANLDGSTAVFAQGFATSGPAWETLTRLLQDSGLQFTVQGDALVVTRKGQALPQSAVLLSQDTGLLGTPSVDGTGLLSGQALLVPGLFPGRLVQIQSEAATGLYRLDACRYTGSLFGGDFTCAFEGRVPG